MKTHTKITALVSSILLSAALATPAHAVESGPTREVTVEALTVSTPAVVASSDASVSFERTPTTSSHVEPVMEAPVVEVQSGPPAPVPQQQAAAPQVPVTAPAPVQTLSAAPAAPVASNGSLASAALAQLGIQQDCTRMVENALAAIGKPVGDLGPAQFLSVGAIVGGEPQAGDILVYGNSHVAIALGNGQAVHGGFNGGTTAVGPVDVGQGAPTVVRV